MKRTAFVVVLMLLVLAASSIGFAREPAEMKGQMMGGQMVATKDGGVIVLMGKGCSKQNLP